MLWGFSEACDLYEEYKKHVSNGDNESVAEINILLFGSSDPRHIIKALAKSYEHKVKLHFFVLEGCPALIARQILLLSIALEPSDLLTPTARTHLFMDIYGNSLLRSTSIGYVDSKANHLIKCVTDLEFNSQMQPIFDFNYLKFIERDLLENTFSFLREKESNQFDMCNCWLQRLQQNLKARFDSREGVYDWDHQMRLKDNGAQQICTQEYRHWRETGIAFTFPEYRQSHANKTFAMKPSNNMASYSYVGDMTVGPFCAFGLSCSDQKLLRSSHGQNEYRATDISERNIFELFYEIHERKLCSADMFSLHKLGMTKIDTGKTLDSKGIERSATEMKQFNQPLISTPQVQVSFLSMSDAQLLVDGKKFQSYFDIVFVGRNYYPILKEDFAQTFKQSALVLFETAQFSIQRKPEVAEFLMKIRNTAKNMQLKSISNFNINVPLPIAKFINIK